MKIIFPLLSVLCFSLFTLKARAESKASSSSSSSNSMFRFDIYAAMYTASSKFTETTAGVSYDHQAPSDHGVGLAVKPRLKLGPVLIGAVAEIGNEIITWDRTNNTTGNYTSYKNQRTRYMAGPSIGFAVTNWMTIEGDYYAHISGHYHYSDEDFNRNPVKKGDKFTGSGYAYGLMFNVHHFLIGTMFRQIKMTQDEHTNASIPSAVVLSDVENREAVLNIGMTF